jgi:hypothetical protein
LRTTWRTSGWARAASPRRSRCSARCCRTFTTRASGCSWPPTPAARRGARAAEPEWERTPLAPQALLELANGASSLRDWPRAERAAETARDLAQRRGLGQVIIESEAVLDAARRKRGVDPAVPAATEELGDPELAADLVRSLSVARR